MRDHQEDTETTTTKVQGRDRARGRKISRFIANRQLLMQWKGPFTIVEKVGKVDYKIDIGGKLKTFHANMLKL